jgi:hypothetical protein
LLCVVWPILASRVATLRLLFPFRVARTNPVVNSAPILNHTDLPNNERLRRPPDNPRQPLATMKYLHSSELLTIPEGGEFSRNSVPTHEKNDFSVELGKIGGNYMLGFCGAAQAS